MESGRHKLQDIMVCETFLSDDELNKIISGLEIFPNV